MFETVLFTHGQPCPSRNIWERLEVVLVATTRGTRVVVAAAGIWWAGPRMMPHILQCTGWPHNSPHLAPVTEKPYTKVLCTFITDLF